ncbi:Uncharacterized protein dnm_048100 [Desulfonema magnum]|uniref:Uncharacterized protein n=1 Tax=Desulfonema magnum TaxID=45655 RepID=A0A975BNI9_9BACT|nr:Uncharacterized protein dnm_048100 [Desulfonema magnum]
MRFSVLIIRGLNGIHHYLCRTTKFLISARGRNPGFFSGMMLLRQRKNPGVFAARRKKAV